MSAYAHARSSCQGGFTLPELLIAVTILGILAALAAPSFSNLIANQRIRSASMDLVSQLTYARSEAIKQNDNITVRSAANNTAWQGGWTITDASGTLKTQESYGGLTITGTAASVVFDRSGRSTTASIKFEITPATSGSGAQPRCVVVGLTGQPASTQGSCS